MDKNVLDLHGIYPNQVGQVIEEKVADMKKRNWKNLYVVTGERLIIRFVFHCSTIMLSELYSLFG